jgi:hypothetical protein
MDFSVDDDDEVTDTREVAAPSQTPYPDAVRRGSAPASKPALFSIVVQPPRGEGGHRKRPQWRGRRPPSPPPRRCSRCDTRRRRTTEMVIGLRRYDHPHKVDRATFAPCVDPDGWQRVQRRRVSSRVEGAPQPKAPERRCFHKKLDG